MFSFKWTYSKITAIIILASGLMLESSNMGQQKCAQFHTEIISTLHPLLQANEVHNDRFKWKTTFLCMGHGQAPESWLRIKPRSKYWLRHFLAVTVNNSGIMVMSADDDNSMNNKELTQCYL